eukprot:TRINITY_DN37242_c0_g1_i4.p3 TRINITY_DN37242_c0_g1~~TRINITY_DN37242_c0_g1_i4.p3  ORF type:complete len:198 (+),score=-5.77 TRINITY_DN37242_c0_g1_i4:550-1143(+)
MRQLKKFWDLKKISWVNLQLGVPQKFRRERCQFFNIFKGKKSSNLCYCILYEIQRVYNLGQDMIVWYSRLAIRLSYFFPQIVATQICVSSKYLCTLKSQVLYIMASVNQVIHKHTYCHQVIHKHTYCLSVHYHVSRYADTTSIQGDKILLLLNLLRLLAYSVDYIIILFSSHFCIDRIKQLIACAYLLLQRNLNFSY